MTVLVDQARWRWRGLRWAHLVSDAGATELHCFAARLGLRRLSFQGDHYDVTVAQRAVAVSLGALAVDSRVLVRRLRVAGLRRPAGSPSWRWRTITERTLAPGDRSASALDHDAAAVAHAVAWFDGAHPRHLRVVQRVGEVGVVVTGRPKPGGRARPQPAGWRCYGPHPTDGADVVLECLRPDPGERSVGAVAATGAEVLP